MTKKNIFKQNKYYIFIGIIFVLTSVAFVGLTNILINKVKGYKNTQKEIASTLLTYKTNDDVISTLKKYNINNNNYSDSLPSQDTIVKWIEQTEIMAQDNNIEQTLSFTNGNLTKDNIVVPQVSNSQSPFISGNITLKGNYNSILSYINMFEHSYYYTRINAITFSAINKIMPTAGIATTVTPAQVSTIVTSTITFDLFVRDLTKQPSQNDSSSSNSKL